MCRRGGWGWTSAATPRRTSASGTPGQGPSSGTGRWGPSSSSRSPGELGPSPRQSLRPRVTRWSGAAIRWRRCRGSGWQGQSIGSRPAVAPRSNCWRGGIFPASRLCRTRARTAMADRTSYLAANWKMHKTTEEAERFLAEFLPRVSNSGPEVAICPPFTSLNVTVELCFQSPVRVAAQNMHEAEEGAFTGEVSAPMLLDLGVDGVILGHSERRQHFAETDEALARKVPAALGAGLEPILCVGENEAQRDRSEE